MRPYYLLILFLFVFTVYEQQAQYKDRDPNFSVEYIVTDSIQFKYDTLVQINVILYLNDKLFEDASKIYLTAEKPYGHLVKSEAVYNLSHRTKIGKVSSIKTIDSLLIKDTKLADSRSGKAVLVNQRTDTIKANPEKTKDKSGKELKPPTLQHTADTIMLSDKVFMYDPLKQIKINFGLFKKQDSSFTFNISIEDKNHKVIVITPGKEVVKKNGKNILSKDLDTKQKSKN